jgi:RNA polymerase sigma-70 factor (ECF subfamily)
LDDRTLVQGLLQKDKTSEEYFFQNYRPRLYRIATFILGFNDPEAEDVVQETFLVAIQELPKFEFRSTFLHWLRRICVYRCYERIRQRKRQVVNLDEDIEKFALQGALSKADENTEKEEQTALLQILKTEKQGMGEKCRELLDLRDVQGKSYAELSKHLKVAIGTVMSRLARCKEALKQKVLKAAGKRGLWNA